MYNEQRPRSMCITTCDLLTHYCEDPTIDKANKMWDYNPEEDNQEDGALVLENIPSPKI